MGDEENRPAFLLELLDPLDALALEGFVADRQHLVDQEDVGLDVHGDRETQAYVHARRVVPHLHVDEPLELGERDDLVEDLRGVAFRQSEDRGIHEDVLATRELVVETRAELEQRGHASPRDDLAPGRLQDAGDALEQRRLAAAVVPEDADRRALLDVEVDVLQSHERLVGDPAVMDDPFLQRRVVLVVELELLRDAADLDRRRHLRAPRRSSPPSARTPVPRSPELPARIRASTRGMRERPSTASGAARA